MARTADYTIQGFIYQFLVTISKLLEYKEDTEMIVEGIIEDIDVVTPTGVEAYQCKYHETKTKFTLSSIYKPILQMLCHFKDNQTSSIKYRLHAHFPNEPVNTIKTIGSAELDEVLKTQTSGLQPYVTQLIGFSNTAGFLKRFEIHFGASYEDTERSIIVALSKEGLSTEDVEEIFYPNAVHKIAEISIMHNVNDRKIKKNDFLSDLKEKKRTAISRWTKELQSYKELLKKRREQLRDNLNKNCRKRGIILDADYLDEFDKKGVQLIEDFINKYNSKPRLNCCPLFSLICTEDRLNEIWERLVAKNIKVERGIRAGKMDPDHFLRDPIRNSMQSEFVIRVCNHNNDFNNLIEKAGIDDLIIITNKKISKLDILKDVNIETIETNKFNEVRFLLSLNNSL